MKHLKLILYVAVFFLLSVAGCISDEANRYYLQEKFPAKNVNDVEILKTAPVKPYIVVADFQANKASPQYMRKRAAEIGADAVIVVPVGGNYSRKEVWAGQDRYAETYSRMMGTAIKYKTE